MSGDHNMFASGSGDGQRSGWRKRTIMEMANETLERMEPDAYCREPYWSATDDELKAFAKLVREEATAEANARANASWTLMCEKMVAIEREACVKVCEEYDGEYDIHPKQTAEGIALQIRARTDHAN